ncbi:MAG: hypothetical protein C0514_04055 [Candidatus Puniceispirillum sp.]|nr:hypothetical protein [Candidatus Puniceispirillum sp.]MCA0371187.1 hypothetical protein [Pseudomonadota bacterium]
MKDSSKFATLALAGLLTVGLASSTFAGDNHDEKAGCKAKTDDPQKDKKKSKGGSSCSTYSCAVGF